jgi:hypothetical protein
MFTISLNPLFFDALTSLLLFLFSASARSALSLIDSFSSLPSFYALLFAVSFLICEEVPMLDEAEGHLLLYFCDLPDFDFTKAGSFSPIELLEFLREFTDCTERTLFYFPCNAVISFDSSFLLVVVESSM